MKRGWILFGSVLLATVGCTSNYLGGCGGDSFIRTLRPAPPRPLPLGLPICAPKGAEAQAGDLWADHGGAVAAGYGAAFTTGNFDDDLIPDLAIGLPFAEARDAAGQLVPGAGNVVVCWGLGKTEPGACSFSPERCQRFQDPAGPEQEANFGAGLGAYPTNLNDALVIGAPGARVGDQERGSIRGMEFKASTTDRFIERWWRLESRLPFAVSDTDARWGHACAAGEFSDTTDIEPPGFLSPDLAIGAPGWDFRAGSVPVQNVGAVEVVMGNGQFQSPGVPGQEVPAPFYSAGHFGILPTRTPDCQVGGNPQPCPESRYGTALAVGRFHEDATRGASLDIAVGAPGTPAFDGTGASIPRAGKVEVLNDIVSTAFGLSPGVTADLHFGDELGAQELWKNTDFEWEPWTLFMVDYSPAPGDEFGSSLFTFDFLPSIWAEVDDGEWKDELVIGAPGHEATEVPVSGLPTAFFSGAGSVCMRTFGDVELQEITALPSELDDPVLQPKQWCLDLADKEAWANPSGNSNLLGAEVNARLGTSVAAGRVSHWDPHFEVVAGAPGEDGGHGAVRALYFDVIWNDSIRFAEKTDEVRVVTVAAPPDYLAGTDGVVGTSDDVTVSALGEALTLYDINCGGVPDIIAGAPGRLQQQSATWDSWGSVVVSAGTEHPQLSDEWSARYELDFEFPLTGASEQLALNLALIEDSPGSGGGGGYTFNWSNSNHTNTAELFLELPIIGELYSVCVPLPWNLPALPGGMPLLEAGDVDDTEDCTVAFPEPTAYSSEGLQWMSFGPPAGQWASWVGFEDIPLYLDLKDQVDWAALEAVGLGDEFSDEVGVRLWLKPTVDSSTGEVLKS